jgi:hypothetical protein
VLAVVEFSAEPTTVGSVYPVLFGFNQRSGLRWAVPRGEGVVFRNADTQIGMVWQVLSDAAGAVDSHAHWWEPALALVLGAELLYRMLGGLLA